MTPAEEKIQAIIAMENPPTFPRDDRKTPDRSPSIDKLAGALAKAQASISPAAKDSENPYFKSKYADLASVYDACRAALTGNDLAIVQRAIGGNFMAGIITTLMHGSGQWIEGTLTVRLDDGATPQQVGSALTYLRRYSLVSMVGIATEDDDGETASARGRSAQAHRANPNASNDNAGPGNASARRGETPPASDVRPAPSSPGKPTLAALRKYHALREGMGVSEDEARERVSNLLARKVTSINDLSSAELGRVIDKMTEAKNGSV